MINHARTLLLNRSGSTEGYGGLPGDEYLPPAYRVKKHLPAYVVKLRSLLLGSDPDRVYANYRVRQYLALLHSTELAEFVTALDPRITYDVDNSDLFVPSIFNVLSPDPDNLFLSGQLGSPDRTGRAHHQWEVTVSTSSTVRVSRQTKPLQLSVQDYTIENSLSSLVSLVGSDMQLRFKPGVGQRWQLEGYARPTKDLGEILAELESLGASSMLDLFGIGSPRGATEPFKTFWNLWKDHPELAYRIGGVVLALIYRMNEL